MPTSLGNRSLSFQWAKRLVYAASDEPASERSEKVELVLVGVGNKGWNFGTTFW